MVTLVAITVSMAAFSCIFCSHCCDWKIFITVKGEKEVVIVIVVTVAMAAFSCISCSHCCD